MCIAMPMKILELLPDGKAIAERGGNRVTIDRRLLSKAEVGDYALVHAGYAIELVDGKAAADILTLFEEISSDEQ